MKIDINNTYYEIKFTSKFAKDLKLLNKQNKSLSKLKDIIIKLANNEVLEKKYRDHQLSNSKIYKNCRECHIEPDWLLVYKKEKDKLILLLVSTGTHSELF